MGKNRVWSAKYYEHTWPYLYLSDEVKKPSDLQGTQNGRLDNSSLATISKECISLNWWKYYGHSGSPSKYNCYKGHRLAVAAMELMIRCAALDGIDIRVEEGYRSYEQQDATWKERYTLDKPKEARWLKQAQKNSETADRKLKDYFKEYQGQVYWLKEGNMSPCSTPGDSNHGWGLAFDVEFALGGSTAKQEAAIEWTRKNSFAFGFYWVYGHTSTPGFENWHLTYSFGDDFGCLPLLDKNINFLPTTPKSYTKVIPASKKIIKNKGMAQKSTTIVKVPAKTITVQPDAIPRIPQMVDSAKY